MKVQSSTNKTTVEVNPDRTALIFKSRTCESGVYWPIKDWLDLKVYVDALLNGESK